MADTHYCRGHAVLAEHAKDLPTDAEGRPLPGFHPFLMRRELYEALHPDDE